MGQMLRVSCRFSMQRHLPSWRLISTGVNLGVVTDTPGRSFPVIDMNGIVGMSASAGGAMTMIKEADARRYAATLEKVIANVAKIANTRMSRRDLRFVETSGGVTASEAIAADTRTT